jgi:hypothetical protein
VVLLYIAWRKFVAPILRPAPRQEYVEPGYAIETQVVGRGAEREAMQR